MSTQSPPSPSASSRPSQTAYKTCTASLQPSSSYDDATPRSSTSARRITDLAYPTPSSSSASARHPGCVLCSIVAQASSTMAPQELSPSAQDLSPSASPLPSPNPDTAFFNPYAIARYPQPVTTGADGGKTTVTGREILYQDAEITVYPARGKERLCSGGRHLIVVLNRHLESVYDFVSPSRAPSSIDNAVWSAHRAYTVSSGSCRCAAALPYPRDLTPASQTAIVESIWQLDRRRTG